MIQQLNALIKTHTAVLADQITDLQERHDTMAKKNIALEATTQQQSITIQSIQRQLKRSRAETEDLEGDMEQIDGLMDTVRPMQGIGKVISRSAKRRRTKKTYVKKEDYLKRLVETQPTWDGDTMVLDVEDVALVFQGNAKPLGHFKRTMEAMQFAVSKGCGVYRMAHKTWGREMIEIVTGMKTPAANEDVPWMSTQSLDDLLEGEFSE